MHRVLSTAAAAIVFTAAARGGVITFDDLPEGMSLDDQVIGGVHFAYEPNGSGLPAPRTTVIPWSVSGVMGGTALNGSMASPDFAIRLTFAGVIDGFGLTLSTRPFSSLTPIAADLTFFNAAGEAVFRFESFSETLLPGATLPDGSTVFRFGRSDTSLFRNGVTDAVAAEIRVVGSNPGGWYMDNINYFVVPAPGTGVLLAGAALAGLRRRRG